MTLDTVFAALGGALAALVIADFIRYARTPPPTDDPGPDDPTPCDWCGNEGQTTTTDCKSGAHLCDDCTVEHDADCTEHLRNERAEDTR